MFYTYTATAIQIWLALIPGFFAIAYARVALRPVHRGAHSAGPRVAESELRSPDAVLFSLVLFFQFGNEWAIAGWLPLFLSQRLGLSPSTSILILALYWLALLVGRVAAQWILPLVRHTRLLGGRVLTYVFACVILIKTDNLFGAVTGVLLLGGGFCADLSVGGGKNRPSLLVLSPGPV